jgi:hypothetical protein
LVLLLPVAYRHISGGREVSVPAYKDGADLLSAYTHVLPALRQEAADAINEVFGA